MKDEGRRSARKGSAKGDRESEREDERDCKRHGDREKRSESGVRLPLAIVLLLSCSSSSSGCGSLFSRESLEDLSDRFHRETERMTEKSGRKAEESRGTGVRGR